MQTIKLANQWHTLKLFLLFAGIFCALQMAAQNNQRNEGNISKHEFDTPKGKITILLPTQISSGDVISGKVINEPKGKTIKKQQQNAKILNGYVMDIDENKINLVDGTARFFIPDNVSADLVSVSLRDTNGKLLSNLDLPVSATAPFKFPELATENFSPLLPEYLESGSPVSIIGPFDGDFSNSGIKIGGQDVSLIAESPRELIFDCPENISGIQDILITEQNKEFESEIRVVDLHLSATKTRLKIGEQTNIQIEVTGLENLNSDITLNTTNLTPTILAVEGGNNQEIIITPEMIGDNGIWSGTLSGQSLRTGDFSVQVQVEQPPQNFIIPVSPVGELPFEFPLEFIWNPVNIPKTSSYDLLISKQVIDAGNIVKNIPINTVRGINQNPFILPDELPPLNPGEIYVWQVQTNLPNGMVSSPTLSLFFGPVPPMEFPPGPGDPCEDPKYVENEEKECADIVNDKVNIPFTSGVDLDFDNFKDEWQEHFRILSQTMLQFDLQLSMIKYWIGEGDKIDKQAQQVQKLTGLIKDGIGKGVKAFKEGGEEVMKDMAQEFAEDKVKEFEQYAVGQVSKTLGALYDLEDLAIRRTGLGVAKLITGVYPDKMADSFRRKLQISTTELSGWVCNWQNQGVKDQHPTLQKGIAEMCVLLNQLDQIEKDFDEAVEAAGFICIECEIPKWLSDDMERLRQDIEAHIRKFGDTIDQIRQRLVEARGIANNKKAYEDIARLGSFQGNSAKKTKDINRVLRDSKTEFEEALDTRKQ